MFVQVNKKAAFIAVVIVQIVGLLAVKAYTHVRPDHHGTHSSSSATNQLALEEMEHAGHGMTTIDPHAGHNMGGSDMSGMDPHAGHNMDGHNGDPHAGHNIGGPAGHEGMLMYFHINYNATILFEKWRVDSWQGMLWSCVVVFIMGALYEGLKVLREYLLQKYSVVNTYQVNGKQPLATSEDNAVDHSARINVGSRMCSISHLLQTLLHIVQVVLSYFLMLIFMTYNFYLCLAVAVGAGTGYFLFSWKRSTIVDINEHCH